MKPAPAPLSGQPLVPLNDRKPTALGSEGSRSGTRCRPTPTSPGPRLLTWMLILVGLGLNQVFGNLSDPPPPLHPLHPGLCLAFLHLPTMRVKQ